ncbi:dachshund homolog 1-like [Schistocerca piceifrons]|uniref:dachshund homolog 1-like n=1 Tax=Schistocerca piceifrons TaxID=274613 RepID=UPI001F5EA759|nr:dachshund homolog 1-like [Schistocerca piceifrons]
MGDGGGGGGGGGGVTSASASTGSGTAEEQGGGGGAGGRCLPSPRGLEVGSRTGAGRTASARETERLRPDSSDTREMGNLMDAACVRRRTYVDHAGPASLSGLPADAAPGKLNPAPPQPRRRDRGREMASRPDASPV